MRKLTTEQKIRNRVLYEERKAWKREQADKSVYWSGRSYVTQDTLDREMTRR